jgi:hypothetical protein
MKVEKIMVEIFLNIKKKGGENNDKISRKRKENN